jgi:hypothetical protein
VAVATVATPTPQRYCGGPHPTALSSNAGSSFVCRKLNRATHENLQLGVAKSNTIINKNVILFDFYKNFV